MHLGEEDSLLTNLKVSDTVNPTAATWKNFSGAVSIAIDKRKKHLAARNAEIV